MGAERQTANSQETERPGERDLSAVVLAELEVLKPRLLVCLGATAAQVLLGNEFRVSQQRGELIESNLAPKVMATVHPSSILRALDDETRRAEMKLFVSDLKKAAKVIHGLR